MYTYTEFTSEWKRLHHPSMNVDGDVAFFYDIYVRLHRLVEQEAVAFDERLVLSLLLYMENTAAIGLDGVYEYRYRSVGNVAFSWCENLDMGDEATSQVDRLVSEVVAKAPCSALRGWMTESVLSGDFSRLSGMMTWFPQEDQIMWRIFPDLRFREMMFCCGQTLPSTGVTSAVIPWRSPLPNSSVRKLLLWKKRKRLC